MKYNTLRLAEKIEKELLKSKEELDFSKDILLLIAELSIRSKNRKCSYLENKNSNFSYRVTYTAFGITVINKPKNNIYLRGYMRNNYDLSVYINTLSNSLYTFTIKNFLK